jgi:hypothetical protein
MVPVEQPARIAAAQTHSAAAKARRGRFRHDRDINTIPLQPWPVAAATSAHSAISRDPKNVN